MPVEITISPNWVRWEKGFSRIAIESMAAAIPGWQHAADLMYDKSQQFAHVITGEMKDSCDGATMSVEAGKAVAEILYDSDHAIYEIARGGDHDFLGRAYEATAREFEEALAAVFPRVVKVWN